MTVEELIAFEKDIADLFIEKQIRSPIHLSSDNEQVLIDLFKNIRENDWVLSSHRNHYHALLKGIPENEVRNKILHNNSMHICSKQHRFISSSIVGGCLPIAVGLAIGIKRDGLDDKVWVFVGDMASEMGVFHECTKYASRQELPITFIIEDNELSVDTDTQVCWGTGSTDNIIRYKYIRKFPHVGCGAFVTF